MQGRDLKQNIKTRDKFAMINMQI